MTRKQRLTLAQYFHGAFVRASTHERALDGKNAATIIGDLAAVQAAARRGFWHVMGFMPWECEEWELNNENPSPRVTAMMRENADARTD